MEAIHGQGAEPLVGYWGEPTASINWCETDYEVSHYVAEWWNTVSNIVLVALSTFGVRMCIREKHDADLLVLYVMIAIIGVGSALFHGTLLVVSQQLDETPMILAIVSWCYSLYRKVLPWVDTWLWVSLIVAHNVTFAVVHAYTQSVQPFQLYFLAWVLVGAVRLVHLYRNDFKDNRTVRALIRSYVGFYLLGSAAWVLDQKLCAGLQDGSYLSFNPQGHAWWHVFAGLAGFFGPASLTFYIAEKNGRNPSIEYVGGVLPYVHAKDVDKAL